MAGKAPNKPSVLQSVLVKIVTEILFWQCALPEPWETLTHQPFSFFLSLVWKTQANHWTKRMVRNRLAT